MSPDIYQATSGSDPFGAGQALELTMAEAKPSPGPWKAVEYGRELGGSGPSFISIQDANGGKVRRPIHSCQRRRLRRQHLPRQRRLDRRARTEGRELTWPQSSAFITLRLEAVTSS
jgi:hypothetical protein